MPSNIAGYATYTNSTAGVRLQYPSGWKVTEGGGTSSGVVKFSGPEGTNVILVKARDSKSLDAVKDKFISDMLNETSYNYTFVSTEKTTIAGNPAYNVTLTSSYSGIDLKQMQTIVKKDDQFYMIGYTTALEQWPNYLDEINNMGNSFAITS